MAFVSHRAEALAELDRKFQIANEVIGGKAESYAKAYSPYKTGTLRDSISHDAEDNFRTVVIGTNVYYAPYQELGTIRISPHPFLRPAIENHVGEYMNVLEKILKS